jgi:hypothetical protein
LKGDSIKVCAGVIVLPKEKAAVFLCNFGGTVEKSCTFDINSFNK